jgi:hypothetical protein
MDTSTILPYMFVYISILLARFIVVAIFSSNRVSKTVQETAFWILTLICFVGGIVINYFFVGLFFDVLPAAIQTPWFVILCASMIEVIITYTALRTGGYFAKAPVATEEHAERYKCDDGHVVKSRGEALIDNWLARHGVNHQYEDWLDLGGNRLKYDWYLPDDDVYVEFWGYHSDKYEERRKVKEELYSRYHKKLVGIEDGDLSDINERVRDKLLQFVDEDEFTTKALRPKVCYNCGAKLDDRYV